MVTIVIMSTPVIMGTPVIMADMVGTADTPGIMVATQNNGILTYSSYDIKIINLISFIYDDFPGYRMNYLRIVRVAVMPCH
jgi:hypothetical protein